MKLKAISYLQQAFKLSNHLDFEAGRLLGQVSEPTKPSLLLALLLTEASSSLSQMLSLVSFLMLQKFCEISYPSNHAMLLL
jgi:hypothetical protein